jgi:hypothetical protein
LQATPSLKEDVEQALQFLSRSELDQAKAKTEALAPKAVTPYQSGQLFALRGLALILAKSKEASEAPDVAKILRVVEENEKELMIDLFDRGYFDTMTRFAKSVKSNGTQA